MRTPRAAEDSRQTERQPDAEKQVLLMGAGVQRSVTAGSAAIVSCMLHGYTAYHTVQGESQCKGLRKSCGSSSCHCRFHQSGTTLASEAAWLYACKDTAGVFTVSAIGQRLCTAPAAGTLL